LRGKLARKDDSAAARIDASVLRSVVHERVRVVQDAIRYGMQRTLD
jgi:hypothetical protein